MINVATMLGQETELFFFFPQWLDYVKYKGD
jgi:hypothetical protein